MHVCRVDEALVLVEGHHGVPLLVGEVPSRLEDHHRVVTLELECELQPDEVRGLVVVDLVTGAHATLQIERDAPRLRAVESVEEMK